MWSILIDQLIILTTLTLVTGTVTQPLPSITYTTDEFDGNISELELNTLFKGIVLRASTHILRFALFCQSALKYTEYY